MPPFCLIRKVYRSVASVQVGKWKKKNTLEESERGQFVFADGVCSCQLVSAFLLYIAVCTANAGLIHETSFSCIPWIICPEYDVRENRFSPFHSNSSAASAAASCKILHPYVPLQGLRLPAQRQECGRDTRRQAGAPAEMWGGVGAGVEEDNSPAAGWAICSNRRRAGWAPAGFCSTCRALWGWHDHLMSTFGARANSPALGLGGGGTICCWCNGFWTFSVLSFRENVSLCSGSIHPRTRGPVTVVC